MLGVILETTPAGTKIKRILGSWYDIQALFQGVSRPVHLPAGSLCIKQHSGMEQRIGFLF